MTSCRSIRARQIASVALLLGFCTPAIAQDPGDDQILDEIIVTATLREMPLQEVPMSVGVLTESQLDEIDARDLDDFWRLIPNLAVRDAPFGGNSVIMRGLADTDSFQSTESINAFYVDDTALTYASGLFSTPADIALLDVARVEVLRGPQGTLIGANAMGGAIRIISNEPDPSSPHARIDVNLSDTDEGGPNSGARFMLNQPVGNFSAIRLALLYQDDDGYIDDIGLGRRDVNDEQRIAGRFSSLWQVSDDTEMLARAHVENINVGGYNYAEPNGRPRAGIDVTDDYQFINYTPEPRDEDLRLLSVSVRHAAPWGEFYSATSWYDKDSFLALDWSPELWFFFDIDAAAPFFANIRQRDISQEFRLTSENSGRFNWLAGFYYLDQEARRRETGSAPSVDLDLLDSLRVADRTDISVFGELSWDLSVDLTAVIGARWYSIDRDIFDVSFGGFFGTGESTLSGNSEDISPKASLSWEATDAITVYGLVSQGFRPGQFNDPGAIINCGVREILDPDNLTNWEIGLKSRFAGGRVTVNAAAFHIDWDDMQFDAFDMNCPFVVLDNAGAAESDGVEVDFNWLIGGTVSLQGGLGYTDSRITEGSDNPVVDLPDGTRIPNVPYWTANLSGSWQFQWSPRISGYVRADAEYIDSRTTQFNQSPGIPILEEIGSYTLLNARLGAETGAWRVELFGTNLTNEIAESVCCRSFFDPAVERPRKIGLRGTWFID